jgi:hypothetical protein
MRNKMVALLAALFVATGISVAAPPQSHATTYGSTVICSGGAVEWNDSAVVGIWISQPGGRSGWANFSRVDRWTANWSFDFPNDSPYQIRVGCGGKPERWQTTNVGAYVKPSWASHDYLCDVGRGFCVLS